MAKFCKYCGKKLEKNEKCTCIEKQEKGKNMELEKTKNTIKEEVSSTSKKYLFKIGNIIKDILINPKKAGEAFMKEEDNILTLIMLLLSSVIISFCTVSFLKGIYGNIALYNNFDTYYKTNTMNQMWNYSYFKIFCCILLGIIIGYLILAIVFNIGFEKISKKNITFKKTLAVIAISITEPTIMCIISAFLTIFSYKLSIILILYLLLLFIVNLYENFKQIIKESNHYNHLFIILTIIFGFLAIYLIPNLFL